ncbi:MAG: nucleoside phosphorylase [Fimbriimonadaceae bacterium]|nr:nucleoside phosphorylase [Fimbriimonadaceae bacterium]
MEQDRQTADRGCCPATDGLAALPLLRHETAAPSLFTPEAVVRAVRAGRAPKATTVPRVCVLDFDGDLTDHLVATGRAQPCPAWACFHTVLYRVVVEAVEYGLIPRTIGGPYAVFVAEQLAVSGTAVILGLASAGSVSPELPIPSVVVATAALRDEGTSFHYLPPSPDVSAPSTAPPILAEEIASAGLPVRLGLVWSTDAPYRETAAAVDLARRAGALAVEMQAAPLFAFAQARGVAVALAAHVTNRVGGSAETFEKGPADADWRLFTALCRAGGRLAELRQ